MITADVVKRPTRATATIVTGSGMNLCDRHARTLPIDHPQRGHSGRSERPLLERRPPRAGSGDHLPFTARVDRNERPANTLGGGLEGVIETPSQSDSGRGRHEPRLLTGASYPALGMAHEARGEREETSAPTGRAWRLRGRPAAPGARPGAARLWPLQACGRGRGSTPPGARPRAVRADRRDRRGRRGRRGADNRQERQSMKRGLPWILGGAKPVSRPLPLPPLAPRAHSQGGRTLARGRPARQGRSGPVRSLPTYQPLRAR